VLLTAEDLPTLADDGCYHELLDWVLSEVTPPGGLHGQTLTAVAALLHAYVRQNRLGRVLAGDPGIILGRNPDRVRAPDICFIARERVPAGGIPAGYLEIVPDFVVEIVSPINRAGEVEQKTQEWLQAGVRRIWVVYPETHSVTAYRTLADVRVSTESETIDGAPVLPEFAMQVADLCA